MKLTEGSEITKHGDYQPCYSHIARFTGLREINVPYFKELKTPDEGAHLTRQFVYKQKVEIEELTEINVDQAETSREQQELIDEMMALIKGQNKTLIELLVLTIVAWAYAFFSIAWCV